MDTFDLRKGINLCLITVFTIKGYFFLQAMRYIPIIELSTGLLI